MNNILLFILAFLGVFLLIITSFYTIPYAIITNHNLAVARQRCVEECRIANMIEPFSCVC